METHEPVIGYFKVFTTDQTVERRVEDLDSFEGPPRTSTLPPRIAQWIYTYTRSTREAMREAAERKCAVVAERLGGACHFSFSPIHEVPHAYALRVSTSALE